MARPNPSILLRFSGELTTKAKATRKRFEQHLIRNLRDALEHVGAESALELSRDRYYVRSEHPDAAATLSRVFGLQSVAEIETTPAERLEQVVAEGVRRHRNAVSGRRFAVRARRVGGRDRTPVGGGEVAVALGEALRPVSAGVDLDAPDVAVRVELHGTRAVWIGRELAAPGGLPLGTEGRAVALISGGFDSAVAAWQVMRRGVQLDYVFCILGGDPHLRGALEVTHALAARWAHGTKPRFHAVDFEGVAREIRARVHPRLWQVVLKRQMLRCAEAIARERDAEAIVTGDAIGQVSSQTLTNLGVVSRATELPVLRPLVGANKDDIIRWAEHIGTAEISATVEEYCAMVPARPATAARLSDVDDAERALAGARLAEALEARARFDLRDLDLGARDDVALAVDAVPEGATVIDLRSKAAFAGWHYPGALRLDFDRALAAYRSFERDRRYVLYCEIGMKSGHLAECMRREGFDAAHLDGGLRAAMRCANDLGASAATLNRDEEV